MSKIVIAYKRYSFNYPILSEEEFYQLKAILEVDSDYCYYCFPTKNLYQYLLALRDEFKIPLLTCFVLWLILSYIDSREALEIFLVPLIIWLIFGGLLSFINFTYNILGYNKYYKKLKEKFPNFENYDQYLYFRKFEAIKLMASS